MIIDELRVIGSPQTNVVMSAEVIRVSQRVLGRRPPEPRKEGLGQLVYPFDAELAAALVASCGRRRASCGTAFAPTRSGWSRSTTS
ncbi:MAG: hypothetical protein IPI49_18640 [Myxococcales bacterium]|nr:hypothetical protein [Myxococcales bacterium]